MQYKIGKLKEKEIEKERQKELFLMKKERTYFWCFSKRHDIEIFPTQLNSCFERREKTWNNYSSLSSFCIFVSWNDSYAL